MVLYTSGSILQDQTLQSILISSIVMLFIEIF